MVFPLAPIEGKNNFGIFFAKIFWNEKREIHLSKKPNVLLLIIPKKSTI
jgi:hypothetical protein